MAAIYLLHHSWPYCAYGGDSPQLYYHDSSGTTLNISGGGSVLERQNLSPPSNPNPFDKLKSKQEGQNAQALRAAELNNGWRWVRTIRNAWRAWTTRPNLLLRMRVHSLRTSPYCKGSWCLQLSQQASSDANRGRRCRTLRTLTLHFSMSELGGRAVIPIWKHLEFMKTASPGYLMLYILSDTSVERLSSVPTTFGFVWICEQDSIQAVKMKRMSFISIISIT